MERWPCTSVRNAVKEQGRGPRLLEDGSRGALTQCESTLDLDLDYMKIYDLKATGEALLPYL